MTHLKILTTTAAVLVSLASTPVFAQVAPIYGPDSELGYGPAPYPYYGETWTSTYAPAPYYAPSPYYAQTWTPYAYGQNWSYDNSGWNGYNNGGYNNTWFDGRTYRSDPRPRGQAIAADRAPLGAYEDAYGGSYARMNGDETMRVSDNSSCEQRFKTFDPATGTYRGRDGKRHACR
jgi:BA14K-like protein